MEIYADDNNGASSSLALNGPAEIGLQVRKVSRRQLSLSPSLALKRALAPRGASASNAPTAAVLRATDPNTIARAIACARWLSRDQPQRCGGARIGKREEGDYEETGDEDGNAEEVGVASSAHSVTSRRHANRKERPDELPARGCSLATPDRESQHSSARAPRRVGAPADGPLAYLFRRHDQQPAQGIEHQATG